ncbi:MAG: TetR/AcrR family transcriptional regulator [Caulobacterales bacterium]|jgi:AcrR family transcriptional regulator
MPRLPDPQLAARRRREILQAALVCFRRRGFHQATMQEICAEARVSPGALYRYFSSKGDIIAAIAAEEHAQIEPLFASLAAGANILDTLEILAIEWLRKFSDDDAPLIADVFAECVRDRALAAEITRNGIEIQDRLADAVRLAQARGQIASELDPLMVVRLIFATLDGLGFRVAVIRDAPPEEAAADFMTMLRRFLAPPPSHPQTNPPRMKGSTRAAQDAQETVK